MSDSLLWIQINLLKVAFLLIAIFFFGLGIRQLLRLIQGYGLKNIYSIRRGIGFKINSDLDYSKEPKLIYKIQLVIEIFMWFSFSIFSFSQFYPRIFSSYFTEMTFTNLIGAFVLTFSMGGLLFWSIGSFRWYIKGWGIKEWSNKLVTPSQTTSMERFRLLSYGLGCGVIALFLLQVTLLAFMNEL